MYGRFYVSFSDLQYVAWTNGQMRASVPTGNDILIVIRSDVGSIHECPETGGYYPPLLCCNT